jgi:hypothetical protein
MLYSINLDKEFNTRFDLGKFMRFEDDCFDPLTSTMIEEIEALEQEGITKIRVEENRPDLLSYRLYGDTQYWWVIMFYNRIYDWEDVTIGSFIKYPSLSALDLKYFTLRQAELT